METRAEMGRLRVLFLAGWFPSEAEPYEGGFVLEHALAAASSNEVIVVHSYEYCVRSAEVRREVKDGVDIVSVIIPKIMAPKVVRDAIRAKRVIDVCAEIIRSGWVPDVIHANVAFSDAGISGLYLSKRFDIPMVVTEHWSGFARGLAPSKRMAVKLVTLPVFNGAARVMPVSRHLGDDLVRWGVRAPVVAVPNVVRLREDPSRLGLPSELPSSVRSLLDSDRQLLLFVGLSLRTKGLDTVLRALREVRRRRSDFDLVVVGGNEASELSHYRRMSAQWELNDCVYFAGILGGFEIAALLRACSFGVQPSLRETFGIAILEYLAAGKRVISSDIEPIRSLLPREKCPLVPPGDWSALARSIVDCLDSRLGDSDRSLVEYVEHSFGRREVGNQLTGVYRDVLCCDA